MEIENKILLDIMREYMRDNDVNQLELSRRLGVAQPTVTHWFQGRNNIKRVMQDRILSLCEKQVARMTGEVLASMPILEAYRAKLISAVAAANLPPIYRDKVISIILETK